MEAKKVAIYMSEDRKRKLRYCANRFGLSMNAYVGMLVEFNYKALNSETITNAVRTASEADDHGALVYGPVSWNVTD